MRSGVIVMCMCVCVCVCVCVSVCVSEVEVWYGSNQFIENGRNQLFFLE